MESNASRASRVARAMQQALGALLISGIQDPRVGFVTLTEIRLTPDLRSAWAYVSIAGDERERERSLAGLQQARRYLRHAVGQALALPYVPELHFKLDDTLQRAARIEQLLIHGDGAAAAITDLPKIELDRAPTPEQLPKPAVVVRKRRSAKGSRTKYKPRPS